MGVFFAVVALLCLGLLLADVIAIVFDAERRDARQRNRR